MVKDIPAGATVVGIPGRIIGPKKDDSKSQQREAMAKKIGFDAYGTTQDTEDPVTIAVNCMLDHIHAMDNAMAEIRQACKKMGIEIPATPLPELDMYDIDSQDNNTNQDESTPNTATDNEGKS